MDKRDIGMLIIILGFSFVLAGSYFLFIELFYEGLIVITSGIIIMAGYLIVAEVLKRRRRRRHRRRII